MAGLIITPDEFTVTPDGFSTENRYIREVADPGDATMAMAEGRSLHITYPSGTELINWRFEVGDLVVTGYAAGGAHTPYPAAGLTTTRKVAI